MQRNPVHPFLALVLRKALQDRLQAKRQAFEWAEVIADLDTLQQVHVQFRDKHLVRSRRARRPPPRSV